MVVRTVAEGQLRVVRIGIQIIFDFPNCLLNSCSPVFTDTIFFLNQASSRPKYFTNSDT